MDSRIAPKVDFFKKMKEITKKSHPTIRRDNTGVGATLEYLLGIRENNKDEHDFIDSGKFKGIRFELKGKRTTSSTPVSLKTKSPHGGMTNQELLEKYGYKDTHGKPRKNLKTVLHPNYGTGPQNRNWKSEREGNKFHLFRKGDGRVSWYELDKVGLEKLENLITVEANRVYKDCSCNNERIHKNGKHEYFTYKKATIFLNMKWEKLYEMIDSNKMVFEFRLHKKLDGSNEEDHDPKHDRGNVFRVPLKNLELMYESKQEFIF